MAKNKRRTNSIDERSAGVFDPNAVVHGVQCDVLLSELVEDPKNCRVHDAENEAAVTASIQRYGQTQALVVQRGTNVVLAGNLRLKVLRKLGFERCSVVHVDLSEADQLAYALADNRTAELAKWDWAAVAAVQAEIPADLLMGWTPPQIESVAAFAAPGEVRVPKVGDGGEVEGEEEISDLLAPFPWFGGKRDVARVIWRRLGDVRVYVEPFCGSLAVLLSRPPAYGRAMETVNDIDADLTNFWRAMVHDVDGVVEAADWPINELDVYARGQAMFHSEHRAEFVERMRNEEGFFDPKWAGWWVNGQSAWTGGGYGPTATGRLKGSKPNSTPQGVHAARNLGVQKPTSERIGVHATRNENLRAGLGAIHARLRRVRVLCGSWERAVTPAETFGLSAGGPVGVLLDPPYAVKDRAKVYQHEEFEIGKEVVAWALEAGKNRAMRIAYCGYDVEGEALEAAGWDVHAWKTVGGYANQQQGGKENNRVRERVWFSPGCLGVDGRESRRA